MTFIVHGIPGSPYVRSPLIALEEKGVHYRLAPIAFGTQRSPEWREWQPFGKVPAFEHEGMRFYETQAFLRYLDRVVPAPALSPSDPRALLRMDQMLNIVDSYVAKSVSAGLSFGRVVAPKLALPVDEAAIAAALPEARTAVDEIARLLSGDAYLAGEAISLADIHTICHLGFLPLYAEGQALLAPHPHLSQWIARMEARPSVQATTWERLAEAA
jgi:glutathione S-transferase